MSDEAYMNAAVALSAEALSKEGTEPFGAVVVRNGEIVGRGLNHALANLDPTSHGEVEAIRDACRNLGTLALAGCDLYTSCEPCPLCIAAIEIAGIERVFHATGLEEANKAIAAVPADVRPTTDIVKLRRLCGQPVGTGELHSTRIAHPSAMQILKDWAHRKSGQ
jgi:tRNA(Arg) A34 adenosine deaminase TadA